MQPQDNANQNVSNEQTTHNNNRTIDITGVANKDEVIHQLASLLRQNETSSDESEEHEIVFTPDRQRGNKNIVENDTEENQEEQLYETPKMTRYGRTSHKPRDYEPSMKGTQYKNFAQVVATVLINTTNTEKYKIGKDYIWTKARKFFRE